MDWSVQQIAKLAGTTGRTLRHYDDIGLLKPSRTGHNGYRYYGPDSLVRLQRILLLRDLGLGLPAIVDVLAGQTDAEYALGRHLEWLQQEQERLGRQIASVRHTIEALQTGGKIMAEEMFDGFDHTRYREEVQQRWGKDAYATSDAWWRGMQAEEKAAWQEQSRQLGTDWRAAAESGVTADSVQAQDLARRHVEWLRGIPGTPAAPAAGTAVAVPDIKGYMTGLGEMYVADPRFAANYGGAEGAAFVRDALRIYAETRLSPAPPSPRD
ncbi:DNA-binding transcriptional regulator, MerR family [Arthrobacter sp. ok909]|uniref:MerR family transcriptional regulator n=1 Tax=Arthrobacter sp. ok909 TaxID=1761746 RepID=UPI00088D9604|nr:MerR family transcriptional regulator [Arthrobacter sp. ok909]SDP23419.1 DNA-binding transcriptional regulator, MerR family [Arthrobacter sp. ok909]